MAGKARNGEGTGEIISVSFNLHPRDMEALIEERIPVEDMTTEMKAFVMSRRLAQRKKGARKQMFIALLAALFDYEAETYQDVDSEYITGQLLKRMLHPNASYTPSEFTEPERPKVVIRTTNRSISKEEIAQRMVGSASSNAFLLDDDDD
jgi:hypothetical protein